MSAITGTHPGPAQRWGFFLAVYALFCAAAAVMGVFSDGPPMAALILLIPALVADRNAACSEDLVKRWTHFLALCALLCLARLVMGVFTEVPWFTSVIVLTSVVITEREGGAALDTAKRWALFLVLFGLLYLFTYVLGIFADSQWDIKLLLLGNPDRHIPVLDELVILSTDFDTYFFVLVTLAWQIGYFIARGSARRKEIMARVFIGLGVFFALWHGAGLFVHNWKIFWWPEYEYKVVFIPLAIAFYAAFHFMGRLYVRMSEDDQRRLMWAFWLALLAVVFTNVIGEDYMKASVQRHRPLHEYYQEWNGSVRILKDEIVRGSYSYISGHASSFFTLLGLYFWVFRQRGIRAALLGWAAFHAYTRIYTAAHFPYCTIMGSLFGFAVATMIWFILVRDRENAQIKSLSGA